MFSMTAYFSGGIEVRRPHDDAVDVGAAVAAFRHEHFRRLPSGFRELADVSPLELVGLGVTGGPQLEHGREVDAGVGIDVVLGVG